MSSTNDVNISAHPKIERTSYNMIEEVISDSLISFTSLTKQLYCFLFPPLNDHPNSRCTSIIKNPDKEKLASTNRIIDRQLDASRLK